VDAKQTGVVRGQVCCDFVALDAEGGSGPSDFPLLVQRKVTKGEDAPVRRWREASQSWPQTPLPSAARKVRRLRNSLTIDASEYGVVDGSAVMPHSDIPVRQSSPKPRTLLRCSAPLKGPQDQMPVLTGTDRIFGQHENRIKKKL
jgi:hypothetical protein